MSLSIAQMRASTRTSLPEWTYPMCLAQALVAEIEALDAEETNLRIASATPDDDQAPSPPRKLAEGPNPRLAEIAERKAELHEEMREHTGELRLRGKTAGEWMRWVDAHPAREGNALDELVAYGMCDASALADSLGEYVVAWNGDDLADSDWDFIISKAAPGDIKGLCRSVVAKHETPGMRAPGKSPSPLSGTTDAATS